MKLGNETFHRYSRDQSRRVALARLLMKNSILILHPNRITMVKMVVIFDAVSPSRSETFATQGPCDEKEGFFQQLGAYVYSLM